MNTILEMRGIRKTFPGVVALDNVNLRVRSGEIHAIVGENGAGKSTLMKVLSGVYTHGEYSGDIEYQGEVRKFRDISDSEHIGIIIIHQELALVPLLSIAENIFLGNEPSRLGVIDWELAQTKTRALLKKVGLNEKPDTDHQSGRRQAATDRNRQGAEQGRQAADPRRADRQPERERQRGPARPAAGTEAARHCVDPDFAQAQRDFARRRRHHRAARR